MVEEYIEMINEKLTAIMDRYTLENAQYQKECTDAMRYSLMAGGKRIRPVLTLMINDMYKGFTTGAIEAACAVEIIHTFSLIHDDLPCMDNDDVRRGKPACHKAFGEDVALLAGDALENLAFDVIAGADIDDTKKIKLIKELTQATGIYGMIGGQTIDIRNNEAFSKEKLLAMYGMKTGALIKAACKMGCICASEDYTLALEYAENLGLAYQIIDDILDITSDEATLGKPINSDRKQNKATYPEVFGLEEAYEAAKYYTAQALYAAKSMPDCKELYDFTMQLLLRKK